MLGAAARGTGAEGSFGSVIIPSAAAAGGFALLLMLLTALQQRLAGSDIPAPFQGSSILLITGGMIALALMGFTGLA
jgi:electron transport complex protein RnfA